MRLTVQMETGSAICFIGRRSVAAAQGQIDALRTSCGQLDDILTSTQVVLANAERWASYPVVVVLLSAGRPYGAVLLHGGRLLGLPTGILRAGHLCGRGAVIGPPARRLAIAEAASRLLVSRGLVHTVILRVSRGAPDDTTGRGWHHRPARSSIDLDRGQESLRTGFSYKLRRNVSYYRRKAERDFDCAFVPDLSRAQSADAARSLLRSNRWSARRTSLALRYERALSATQHGVALGLQDSAGLWLSYLAGWRAGDTLYVEWQLNSGHHLPASLSTVMRSYVLDHEIARGTRRVVFVGGTTALWARACQEEYCADMIVFRGPLGALTRWLSPRLRPTGEIADLQAKSLAA